MPILNETRMKEITHILLRNNINIDASREALLVHLAEMYEQKESRNTVSIAEQIDALRQRQKTCWQMVQTFMENRDAHGVMDMGSEIQALERAITELQKL